MIKITHRKSTQDETIRYKSPSTDISDDFSGLFVIWLISAVPLSAILFIATAEFDIEFVYIFLIAVLPISIFLTKWIDQEVLENIRFGNIELTPFDVEVIRCTSGRAIKLEATKDYDAAYFLEVEKEKVLFVDEQIFSNVDFQKLPNTVFEMIIDFKTGILIDFNLLGEKFEPELILNSYSNEEIEMENFPEIGEFIEKSLDQIIIERQNM